MKRFESDPWHTTESALDEEIQTALQPSSESVERVVDRALREEGERRTSRAALLAAVTVAALVLLLVAGVRWRSSPLASEPETVGSRGVPGDGASAVALRELSYSLTNRDGVLLLRRGDQVVALIAERTRTNRGNPR